MIVLTNKYLLRKKFTGMTLWPFIILRNKNLKKDAVLMNHEKIHLKQQLELLILPFFLLYGIEFIVRLIQFGNRHKAYRNISFEREAYSNEEDFQYLNKRSLWKFRNYL